MDNIIHILKKYTLNLREKSFPTKLKEKSKNAHHDTQKRSYPQGYTQSIHTPKKPVNPFICKEK